MNGAKVWFAFLIASAIAATPAWAGWTGKPVNDGHGHSYFYASSRVDDVTVALFCGEGGVVNLSLDWPDRAHGDAAETGIPALMTVTAGGVDFAAKSYYWASGKGRLVLDFGNPAVVADIVRALAEGAAIAVAVDDPVRNIARSLRLDPEGAPETAAAFLDWCPMNPPPISADAEPAATPAN